MNAHTSEHAALAKAAAGVQVTQASYADFLIECVALAVQDIHDPRDRLARQVGMLQGTIRNLCAQLDEMESERDRALKLAEEEALS
jgi:hypothetical protein